MPSWPRSWTKSIDVACDRSSWRTPLAATLRHRVDLVLPVARGHAEMLSMHTATLGLIEALLVGVATKRPGETLASLKELNEARERLAGTPMNLPVSTASTSRTPKLR